jgi:hypothetical protein
MHRVALNWGIAVLAVALLSSGACTDVGDNTFIPPEDITGGMDSSMPSFGGDSSTDHDSSSADASSDASQDATTDGIGPDSTADSTLDVQDSAVDSAVATDSPVGVGPQEAGPSDMGAPDAGMTPDVGMTPEAAAPDTGGPPEEAGPDTSAVDAGPPDQGGAPDMGIVEDAAPEAEAPDTGTADAGSPDSGAPDTGAPDAGVVDTGAPDTGADSGPNPDCAANNSGADCTPTEALFEAHSPSCYNCLVNAGCLDDLVTPGDTLHECGDVMGTAARGNQAGAAKSTLCLETIQCILQHGACASTDVSICYCGTLGAGDACSTSTDPNAPNGACKQAEIDGLEHLSTEPPSQIVPDYFNHVLGAGVANQIFACAASNGGCPTCLQ